MAQFCDFFISAVAFCIHYTVNVEFEMQHSLSLFFSFKNILIYIPACVHYTSELLLSPKINGGQFFFSFWEDHLL